MDTATPIFYTAIGLFAAVYIWVLSYHSGLGVDVMVARIRQLDCDAVPLERDTLRYQLFTKVGPDSADTTSIVGLKQFTLVGLALSMIAAILLTRVYYAIGEGLWIACAALAAVSFALLATTFYTLGAKFSSNALYSPILQKYGANRAAVIGLLDQLKATNLLNQLARNASAEAATASNVTLANDEPNAILSAAAATGTPAPTFSMPLYQLQLRLLQRVKNVRGIVSAKEAATYLNSAPSSELFTYLQLNSDGDYALFLGLLPMFSGPNSEMTQSYNSAKVSATDTNSDVLQINTEDNSKKDPLKLNYTTEELAKVRRAFDELINVDSAPYANEFREYQESLTRMLYAAPIILLFFVFKWYIYKSSRMMVALAASVGVTAYILYYSYFG
jgi:hypothetical protein